MSERRKIESGAIAGGLTLIVIGVLFMLDRFTSIEFGDVMRSYWPFIVILVGFSRLFSRETAWAGLWLIAVGTWLQFAHLHILGLTYRNSWPLLLIALGGGMVVRALIEAAIPEEENHEV